MRGVKEAMDRMDLEQGQKLVVRQYLWAVATVLLLFSCGGVRQDSDQNRLKILNSFTEDETLFRIWPKLVQIHQRTSKQAMVARNVLPHSLLYRIRRLYAIDSMPNLVYTEPNSEAGRFMIRHELLQNLRVEQQSGHLAQVPFSPLALVPQGFGQNMLWVIPLTVHLDDILFTNDGLLYKEDLQIPKTIKELKQTIVTLREKGYERPLVLSHNYNDNILNNLLGTIVGRYISPDFFKEAAENPEMYRSPQFREALNLYLDYFSEDGLLPEDVRRLTGEEGMLSFNVGQSAFLLGCSEDAESIKSGGDGNSQGSVSWHALPAEEEIISSERRTLIPGKIRPGYGITTVTYQQAKIQQHAMEFLAFMFTDGIEIYAKEDDEHRIMSVIMENINNVPFYIKKSEFYSRTTNFVDDIRNTMIDGEYEALEMAMERAITGLGSLDRVINVFYTDAVNRDLNLDIMGFQGKR